MQCPSWDNNFLTITLTSAAKTPQRWTQSRNLYHKLQEFYWIESRWSSLPFQQRPVWGYSNWPLVSFCPAPTLFNTSFTFVLILGVLPSSAAIVPFPTSPPDCVEAHQVCSADSRCEALYRGLERCTTDAALGDQTAAECLERQDALLTKHPSLSACKCQRGYRKEEQCLHIYWRVRLLPGQSSLWGGWSCIRC